MNRVEWSDNLRLGVPAMDADHRRLLDITNEFLEAAQDRAPLVRLTDLLGALIAQTRGHFLAEETLLDRNSYPHLAGHRAEHARLLTEAESLHERFVALEQGQHPRPEDMESLTLETAAYLQRWLIDHILADDRPYRPFLMRLT